MSITNIDEFYRDECNKIDANCINAYATHYLDEEDKSKLWLDTSWGKVDVDLTDAVKDAETCTHLTLFPEDCGEPHSLRYEGECDIDCIHGDDLSRIISLTLLKDVDQSKVPQEGDVLIYDGTKWVSTNLAAAIDKALEGLVHRVETLERILTKPEGVPENARIAWGNINTYGDYTNTDKKDSGIYTHSINLSINNDLYFA